MMLGKRLPGGWPEDLRQGAWRAILKRFVLDTNQDEVPTRRELLPVRMLWTQIRELVGREIRA